MITAVNSLGEGYKPEWPQSFLTAENNVTGSLYVWGSNELSAIGLTEDLIEANKACFKGTQDQGYFATKPVRHSQFQSMVHQVASGPQQSVVLCKDDQGTMVIQMGKIQLLREDKEHFYLEGVVPKSNKTDLEQISSLPFQVNIDIPVHKVVCGHDFSGLLTAEGQVFTWGINECG